MNAQCTDRGFTFGPYRLFPWQRLLMEDDQPVKVGSRAFEILTVLVENPGQIISKQQIIGRVWPTTIVDEAALRVHMAALRKILGDGREGRRFIATVPQRGYTFVAPVQQHLTGSTRSCLCGAAPMTVIRRPPPVFAATGGVTYQAFG